MAAKTPSAIEARIRTMLSAGKSKKGTARANKVSRTVVRRISKQENIGSAGKVPFTAERTERFIKRALGIAKYTSMQDIGARAGVSTSTVGRKNIKWGIRDKKAIALGKMKTHWPKFKAVVDLLVNHPEIPFEGIYRRTGVPVGTIKYFNKKLGIQSAGQIAERADKLRRRKKNQRYYRFSPAEKWEIILGAQGIIKSVILKKNGMSDIKLPVDDLAQETIFQSFHALDQLRPDGNPKNYIAGVARNVANAYIRGRTRGAQGRWNLVKKRLEKVGAA
ncbi:MAG: sigma factor [Candidatus Diapherotrites archaeon]|nr:sigma factor [Candidatus Diapherotrites archaeon]